MSTCRPILFNGEMVRAILAGTKTQTRRVVKPQPNESWGKPPVTVVDGRWSSNGCVSDLRCPLGQPGDRLWVRETMWISGGYAATDDPPFAHAGKKPSIFMPRIDSRITREIENVRVERVQEISVDDCLAEGVGLAGVGCGYSAEDAFHELWDSINAKPKPCKADGAITHYVSYPWEDIQETREHRGKPWHVYGNPWVWCYTFRCVQAAAQAAEETNDG